MPSFVVRVVQDRDAPQEFVGIYVANSIVQLEALVDRHCTTCACEYAQLPTDNLYVSDHSVPGPSHPYGDGEGEPIFVGEDSLGEDWHKLFFGDREPAWAPLAAGSWTSDADRHAVIEQARAKLHA